MHRSGRDCYGFLGFGNNFKLRVYKKPKHVTFYRAYRYRYIGSVRYQIMSTLHCLLGRRLATPSIKLQRNLLSHQLPQNIYQRKCFSLYKFLTIHIGRYFYSILSLFFHLFPIIPYDSKYFKLHCAVWSRF